MNAPILKYFQYGHLPTGEGRSVSIRMRELALDLDRDLPDGPEKSAGLLEAKDCFVRAALDIRQEEV